MDDPRKHFLKNKFVIWMFTVFKVLAESPSIVPYTTVMRSSRIRDVHKEFSTERGTE